jgi:HAE1 family hydrophobic/amphiphilic exporter-1
MIRYFAAHRTAANLLMLALIVMGVFGTRMMRRETFPDFASDVVAIDMQYPGAAAEEIEENLVFRIEDAVDGIDGIAEITSIVRSGFCTVRAKVLDAYDVRAVQTDIQNAIDRIDTFPADADLPIVYELDQPDRVMSLAVTGDLDPLELKRVAEDLKDRLVESPFVSLVTVEGFSDRQVRIELKPEALMQWGLSATDIARAVASASVDMPVGSVESTQGELKIRVTDQRRSVASFKDVVVVTSERGGLVRLGDVASVEDTFDETDSYARFDGRRAAIVHIDATEMDDALRIAADVRNRIAAIEAGHTLPPGVRIAEWGTLADDVRGRLNLLIDNGLIGFVLVLITLAVFLNARVAFWVAMGVPVSFLGAIFLMHLMGHTLNMITMFSLVLALGLVVDDAIVLSENICTHHRRGKPPLQAAIDGVSEVWVGVCASMLTTVAAFLPLLFMTGDIGKTLRVMPIGLILALGISLIEGFVILPNHLAHSLDSGGGRPNVVRRSIDRTFEQLVDRLYRPLLAAALRHRYAVLAGAVSAFAACAAYVGSGRLEFTPFPKLDGNVIQAEVVLPAGTHVSIAERVADRLEAGLTSINADPAFRQSSGEPLIKHVMVQFGSIPSAGVGAVEAQEAGSHVLAVMAELLPSERRTRTADDVVNAWRSFTIDIPEVVSIRYQQQQVNPGGRPVEIELSSRDLDQLKAAALDLRSQLTAMPGLSDADDDLRPGVWEAEVRLRDSARPLGLTAADLAGQLRAAFHGEVAQEFQQGRDTVEVRVLHDDAHRRSRADLEDLRVVLPGGRLAPLTEVAELDTTRGYSLIHRKDRMRTVTVTAQLDESLNNAAKIATVLRERVFPDLAATHGISAAMSGQVAESEATAASIGFGFIAGIAIIYFMLAWVFGSYALPLLVMAAIPLGFIGAVVGHVVMGFDLTMPSMVGFVSLTGIVINDSVILLQTLRARLGEGASLREAAFDAGMRRFRAVLLTSVTTIAGLLPMLMETSLQAQFLIPVAISVSFGLLLVTAVVLIIVPAAYLAAQDVMRLLRLSPVAGEAVAGQIPPSEAVDEVRAA